MPKTNKAILLLFCVALSLTACKETPFSNKLSSLKTQTKVRNYVKFDATPKIDRKKNIAHLTIKLTSYQNPIFLSTPFKDVYLLTDEQNQTLAIKKLSEKNVGETEKIIKIEASIPLKCHSLKLIIFDLEQLVFTWPLP